MSLVVLQVPCNRLLGDDRQRAETCRVQAKAACLEVLRAERDDSCEQVTFYALRVEQGDERKGPRRARRPTCVSHAVLHVFDEQQHFDDSQQGTCHTS